MALEYLHLPPEQSAGDAKPTVQSCHCLRRRRFHTEWRKEVAEWLIGGGCPACHRAPLLLCGWNVSFIDRHHRDLSIALLRLPLPAFAAIIAESKPE